MRLRSHDSDNRKQCDSEGVSICACAGSYAIAVPCVILTVRVELCSIPTSSSRLLQVSTLISSRSHRSPDHLSGWNVLEGAGVSLPIVVSPPRDSWSPFVCGSRLFVKCNELACGLKPARLASFLRPPKLKRAVSMAELSYEA